MGRVAPFLPFGFDTAKGYNSLNEMEPQNNFPLASEGGETILLVEDEALLRGLVVLALEDYGFQVLEAGTGAEALSVSERHSGSIHLLLTDMRMPYMTGTELAQRLQALRPEMKVMYMSGYTPDLVNRCVPSISKPYTEEALVDKVREVLGKPPCAASILIAEDEEGVRNL